MPKILQSIWFAPKANFVSVYRGYDYELSVKWISASHRVSPQRIREMFSTYIGDRAASQTESCEYLRSVSAWCLHTEQVRERLLPY